MKPFDFPVQVYWEDTDAGGIVYHANYLKFMERARSTALKLAGVNQKTLMDEGNLKFVVSKMNINFIQSAVLEDELTVRTTVDLMKTVFVVFKQEVLRGDQCLCSADVTVACIDNDGKPARIPASVKEQINKLFEI